MPARIVFDIEVVPNPQFIANAFFQTGERTSQMERPVTDIDKVISNEIRANFDAQGRPTAWEPLADATIRKRGESGPILRDSDTLYDAATSDSGWQTASGGQTVVSELNTPEYGRFHVTGFHAGSYFVNPRDWTYMDPSADEEIDSILSDWIFAPLERV